MTPRKFLSSMWRYCVLLLIFGPNNSLLQIAETAPTEEKEFRPSPHHLHEDKLPAIKDVISSSGSNYIHPHEHPHLQHDLQADHPDDRGPDIDPGLPLDLGDSVYPGVRRDGLHGGYIEGSLDLASSNNSIFRKVIGEQAVDDIKDNDIGVSIGYTVDPANKPGWAVLDHAYGLASNPRPVLDTEQSHLVSYLSDKLKSPRANDPQKGQSNKLGQNNVIASDLTTSQDHSSAVKDTNFKILYSNDSKSRQNNVESNYIEEDDLPAKQIMVFIPYSDLVPILDPLLSHDHKSFNEETREILLEGSSVLSHLFKTLRTEEDDPSAKQLVSNYYSAALEHGLQFYQHVEQLLHSDEFVHQFLDEFATFFSRSRSAAEVHQFLAMNNRRVSLYREVVSIYNSEMWEIIKFTKEYLASVSSDVEASNSSYREGRGSDLHQLDLTLSVGELTSNVSQKLMHMSQSMETLLAVETMMKHIADRMMVVVDPKSDEKDLEVTKKEGSLLTDPENIILREQSVFLPEEKEFGSLKTTGVKDTGDINIVNDLASDDSLSDLSHNQEVHILEDQADNKANKVVSEDDLSEEEDQSPSHSDDFGSGHNELDAQEVKGSEDPLIDSENLLDDYSEEAEANHRKFENQETHQMNVKILDAEESNILEGQLLPHQEVIETKEINNSSNDDQQLMFIKINMNDFLSSAKFARNSSRLLSFDEQSSNKEDEKLFSKMFIQSHILGVENSTIHVTRDLFDILVSSTRSKSKEKHSFIPRFSKKLEALEDKAPSLQEANDFSGKDGTEDFVIIPLLMPELKREKGQTQIRKQEEVERNNPDHGRFTEATEEHPDSVHVVSNNLNLSGYNDLASKSIRMEVEQTEYDSKLNSASKQNLDIQIAPDNDYLSQTTFDKSESPSVFHETVESEKKNHSIFNNQKESEFPNDDMREQMDNVRAEYNFINENSISSSQNIEIYNNLSISSQDKKQIGKNVEVTEQNLTSVNFSDIKSSTFNGTLEDYNEIDVKEEADNFNITQFVDEKHIVIPEGGNHTENFSKITEEHSSNSPTGRKNNSPYDQEIATNKSSKNNSSITFMQGKRQFDKNLEVTEHNLTNENHTATNDFLYNGTEPDYIEVDATEQADKFNISKWADEMYTVIPKDNIFNESLPKIIVQKLSNISIEGQDNPAQLASNKTALNLTTIDNESFDEEYEASLMQNNIEIKSNESQNGAEGNVIGHDDENTLEDPFQSDEMSTYEKNEEDQANITDIEFDDPFLDVISNISDHVSDMRKLLSSMTLNGALVDVEDDLISMKDNISIFADDATSTLSKTVTLTSDKSILKSHSNLTRFVSDDLGQESDENSSDAIQPSNELQHVKVDKVEDHRNSDSNNSISLEEVHNTLDRLLITTQTLLEKIIQIDDLDEKINNVAKSSIDISKANDLVSPTLSLEEALISSSITINESEPEIAITVSQTNEDLASNFDPSKPESAVTVRPITFQHHRLANFYKKNDDGDENRKFKTKQSAATRSKSRASQRQNLLESLRGQLLASTQGRGGLHNPRDPPSNPSETPFGSSIKRNFAPIGTDRRFGANFKPFDANRRKFQPGNSSKTTIRSKESATALSDAHSNDRGQNREQEGLRPDKSNKNSHLDLLNHYKRRTMSPEEQHKLKNMLVDELNHVLKSHLKVIVDEVASQQQDIENPQQKPHGRQARG